MPEATNSTDGDVTTTVVVSGDVTMDWNLALEPLHHAERGSDARASWQRGGAALLADLLETIAMDRAPGHPRVEVRGPEAPRAPIPPGDDHLNHSYAIWSQYKQNNGHKDSEPAWRVSSFLGVDAARTDEAVASEWDRLQRDLLEADVIVLDDGALGFRDHSTREQWRQVVAGGRRPWVILKTARPVAEGPLWEHLLAEVSDHLLVVLAIDDFRSTEVQVSRGLSWERTAQDLFWELAHKPKVNALSRVAHTVVSFGPAGAALISGPSDGSSMPTCTLAFDPERVEGAWEAEQPGRVMGTTDCLVAALTREILLNPEQPDLTGGIQAGVAAERRLHLHGYDERGPGRMELDYPLALVVEEMRTGGEPLHCVTVPDPAVSDRYWTILQDRCTGDLADSATHIATAGTKQALEGVPLGRFGKLVTADRSEIEAFRSIGTLIAEYAGSDQSKPLSIGVFGPPGSGKSFGVREVARSVAPRLIGKPLEFNLAQFRGPDELADALHRVRDEALSGHIPLVFWDEFDASLNGEPMGWLRYFLAPMQDGEFRQGQLTHPIGRSIFVFAGGTCERLADFGSGMEQRAFREAKGPDFVSRLKGYVNVLGPNSHGPDDPYHLIRRAILLRSVLERRAPGLFDGETLRIDPGVLGAFLGTTTYRHGARSLEAIVAMSLLSGKSTYERSSLPAGPQLELHVDADDFLAKAQRMNLEGQLLERLARAAHHAYYDDLMQRGFRYGPVSDDEEKTSDSLVPYDDLPEFKKEQNRRNVRDIPAKLQRLGCVMVPARAGLPPFTLTQHETETLAREEHDRWMQDLGPGWRYGIPTDKPHKVSEAYLPWQDLPAEQKNKDRNLVRQIPAILHDAAYAVVRSRPPAVAIAVTGHRILGETDKLKAGLDDVVHRLEDAYPGPWTVVSALAEGADRLVTHRLLAREGTRLVAVLPLSRADYETDFETEESRREFADLLAAADEVVTVPPQASRDHAYREGGVAVLNRADVLVAVWDGQGAQGAGGTGGIVATARERGLPLLWVHAGNRKPGTLEPTSLGDRQGKVTCEQFPEVRGAAT